jgi:protein TonB
MRTVSVTQPPPSPSTGSRVGTVAILALVGVLGVGAGVLVARQPARTASDTPPATVTYVPATPPPPVTTPPPVVTPTVLPLPLPAPLPATSATTTKSAASAEKSEKSVEKPVEKPKPKPKTKKKRDGDEYGF